MKKKKSPQVNISKQEMFIPADSYIGVSSLKWDQNNLTIFHAWVSKSHFCEREEIQSSQGLV